MNQFGKKLIGLENKISPYDNSRMNPFPSRLNISVILTYVALVFVTLIGLSLIQFFNISYPLTVKTMTASGELAVVGEGKVDVVPDEAKVNAGIVVSNAKTIQDAQNQVNDVNNKIVEALKKLNISAKDIKTTNYSINPNYIYEGGNNRINGYNGNASVTITVKNTADVAQVIEAVTAAGANDVSNAGFSVGDPSKYREMAREKAIENAKEQAQKLADSLGIRLGNVVNIVESTPGSVPPIYMDKAIGFGGGNAAPQIEPGSQTITSTVTLYFEKR